MRSLFYFFRAIVELGRVGLVLAAIVLILVGSMLFQSNQAFDASLKLLDSVTRMEDTVRGGLYRLKVLESYTYYAILYQDTFNPQYQDEMKATYVAMQAVLNTVHYDGTQELVAFGESGVDDVEGQSIYQRLDDFQTHLAAHQGLFQRFLVAYAAGDTQAMDAAYWPSAQDLDDLDRELTSLIRLVEVQRQVRVAGISKDVSRSLLVFSAAIVAILLLSLWAFRLLAGYAEAGATLRNAINAINGERYRPQILGRLLKRPGPTGRAARALDGLAVHLQQDLQADRDELERQRQALFESRRRRLRIYYEEKADQANP